MKKRILAVLLLAAMLLSLSACTKETSVSVTVNNIGSFQLMEIPTSLKNMSVADNTITVTIHKEGSYPFILLGEDGETHFLILTYKNEVTSLESDGLDTFLEMN